ncbi:aa3-type cytochrome c oxidase subunit IV [Brucella sp. BO2]|nr:aa3-type cytochrome c oxidase subunit IV [Brucella sp. BO2]
MAEHHTTAPAELGAPMDYAEHEKTYAGFAGLIRFSSRSRTSAGPCLPICTQASSH